MALTGLQIQKLLPGTNCKECGSNTCLAFAMKLAAKKAEIKECPYASEEAIRILGEATEPPVKKIALGRDQVFLGDETVLYRHEKTFVNRTAFAVNINDADDPLSMQESLRNIREYKYERVGEILEIDMVSVTQTGAEEKTFLNTVEMTRDIVRKPLVLRGNAEFLVRCAELLKGMKSVMVAADNASAERLAPACREYGHALAICGDIDTIGVMTARLRNDGFTDLLLCPETKSLSQQFQANSIARSAAIRDQFKPLGYPFIRFIETADIMEASVSAATEILKYGGICVLPSFDPAQLASLFTLRLNIFTDPQKPIQVEPKLYPIGEPDERSPLFVTTNFSLTYFVVSGEIENSGTSAWLLIPECEGMSVLTAWAAGKFNARVIAASLKESGAEEMTKSRTIVIPGYVAQISGELEELLPGWKVLVGPQEAADIESFVKTRLAG